MTCRARRSRPSEKVSGTKLCRPSEAVFGLLERQPETFSKDDGEVVSPRG